MLGISHGSPPNHFLIKPKNRVNDAVAAVAAASPCAKSPSLPASHPSPHRALNTPDAVSPEVLRKVKDAVERTGYVPNMLAGGLASSKSRLVAAVVPTIAGPVFLETVQALTEALAERGY